MESKYSKRKDTEASVTILFLKRASGTIAPPDEQHDILARRTASKPSTSGIEATLRRLLPYVADGPVWPCIHEGCLCLIAVPTES